MIGPMRHKVPAMLLIFAAALMIGLAAAQPTSPYVEQGKQDIRGTVWNDYGFEALSLLAVATSVSAIALIYMLGYVFSMEEVKRWCVGEFTQAAASAMIVLSLIALVDLALPYVFGFVQGFQDVECGVVKDPITYAQCKTQAKITMLDKMYAAVYNANKGVEAAAATCYSLVNIQFYCGEWHLRPKIEIAHLLGAKITPLLVNLHGQFIMYEYIRKNMFLVFLPIGVLLRTIPPTRGLGGLFIATAIGFYVVYPTLLVIGDLANVNAYVNVNAPDSTLSKCYVGFKGCATLLGEAMGSGGQNADLVYEQVSTQLAQLTIGMMLFPFMAFAATLVFINNAAPLLGGDASMMIRMAQKVIT